MRMKTLSPFLSIAAMLLPLTGYGQVNSETLVTNPPASLPQMTVQDALASLNGTLQRGRLPGIDYTDLAVQTQFPSKGEVVATYWIYDRVDEVGLWGHTLTGIADGCCRGHYDAPGPTELEVAWKDVTSIVRVSGSVQGEWLVLRGQKGVLFRILLRRLGHTGLTRGWMAGIGPFVSDSLGNATFLNFAPFAESDPMAELEIPDSADPALKDNGILRAIRALCPNLSDPLAAREGTKGRVYFYFDHCAHRLNCHPAAVSLNNRVVGLLWGPRSYFYLDLPAGPYAAGANICVNFPSGPSEDVPAAMGSLISDVRTLGAEFKDYVSFSIAPGEIKYVAIASPEMHGFSCHSRIEISLEDEPAASKIIGDQVSHH
jgi:hypothetical protein